MNDICSTSRLSADRMLILATTNENKFFEMRTSLGQISIPLYSLNDLPAVDEAPETGTTFAENAILKAEYYWNHFRKPVLAEDSGLVIPSLGGFPGIHSARIAPTDASRIDTVLGKLAMLQPSPEGDPSRAAYYICSITFIGGAQCYTVQGRCDGTITETPDGDLGFGYDPIFVPEGARKTFGRMSIKEKSQYSHRARAIQLVIPHILEEFRKIGVS